MRTRGATHLIATGLCVLIWAADARANLLRNSTFQDDWLTTLPETKNHHWCYSSEFYNRRDFNPDGWTCTGSWEWRDADRPAGQRRMVLRGPGAELVQRVNYYAINDDRAKTGFPDAGGFPELKAPRTAKPERLLRDLTLRVRVRGVNVPKDAGAIEVGLCPPGEIDSTDPLGSRVSPILSVRAPLGSGTYTGSVEIGLPGEVTWADALKKLAKPPAHVDAGDGTPLPATIRVSIKYTGGEGTLEVLEAILTEAEPDSPNLLRNASFEAVDAAGYPAHWSAAAKYRYFPPGLYYIFNTWHNGPLENRGPVAADALVRRGGARSLKMVVAAGDEKAVTGDAVALNQDRPRLIEATAWVKTDRLCMLQIDAVDEAGDRLDCYDFVNKAPLSTGTNDWRQVRQVFRPRKAVKAIRLMLCARGVNGYTLDDVGTQPQNNVVGTIWWDDVRLCEPESTSSELKARGVAPTTTTPGSEAPAVSPSNGPATTGLPPDVQSPHLDGLDLGERALGPNTLTATLRGNGRFVLRWEFTSPSGHSSKFESPPIAANETVELPYALAEPCTSAYGEYRGTLSMVDRGGAIVASTDLWFGTWTTPIDVRLGAVYLQPDQRTQTVRLNFGLSHAQLAELRDLRLDVIRRGTGDRVASTNEPMSPAPFARQLERIPAELRGDFANLLLRDVDVSALPIQPFNDPQRNFLIRATAVGRDGKVVATADSVPFCRLAHDAPQGPVRSVAIRDGMAYVNGAPWMPWGAVYGHVPRYAGPAGGVGGKFRDLHNLPGWSIYDRYGAGTYTRAANDFNCLRYVAGGVSPLAKIEALWAADNLYCSTAFASAQPAFSLDELAAAHKGREKLDAYLEAAKASPAVVALAPGIEEAFGLFTAATPEKLAGLADVARFLRERSGKPVMVGHGGYWDRLELERVPFFDIYDPETEPLYPANLHTDLAPLLAGRNGAATAWLRPQMYEDVPFERWRFHAYVELMRGARGWQVAHGPGDASLFRGLHGEMEFMKSIVASADAGPRVVVDPPIEHWSRRHDGKTYVIAATTHGMTFGNWKWEPAASAPGNVPVAPGSEPRATTRILPHATGAAAGPGRARVTSGSTEVRNEANAYGIGEPGAAPAPAAHGIQYLPDARAWPVGTKVVQWVNADPAARNLVILVKADGRWTHAAAWGAFDPAKSLRDDAARAYWFLLTFYRHARGFLGWDTKLVDKALPFVPGEAVAMGDLPAAGAWTKIELPLDRFKAAGALVDGLGFLHEGGTVRWGRTSIVTPDGVETVVWGDQVGPPADRLAKVRFSVPGLVAGAKVRALFEDREILADDAGFTDDLRGADLYQRFGGGHTTGYGDTPVALRVYEVPR